MPDSTANPVSQLLRIVTVRPRLFSCVLLGLAVILFLPVAWVERTVTRMLLGWNVGVIVYLILAMRLMFWSSRERMRKRALEEDEGRMVILALVVASALACLAAIIFQLAAVKDMHGALRGFHVGLAAVTLLSSWLFTQTMFGLHYAHDYYAAEARGCDGGLAFPGGHAPDYGDFLYFSCVIGTSGQTADVSFTSRAMRRTGLLHCVLAFFFNTTLLALTINIGSGLV